MRNSATVPRASTIPENIKKNLKNKNPSPEQTLNFILSGGDYSVFVEKRRNQVPETFATPVNPPTLQDIKDKLLMDKK